MFFPLYVGGSLSLRSVLLISVANLFFIFEGVRLLRGGKLYVREKLSLLAIFTAAVFPYVLFLSLSKDFGNTAELVYGELLSFIPYAVLICLTPRYGI